MDSNKGTIEKTDIRSLEYHALTDMLTQMGEKSFRAQQIFNALHKNMVSDINKIHVLPKQLREKLDEKYPAQNLKILKKFTSKIDSSTKYLILLADKNIIETVLMKYKYGFTQCISTQVGCKMGCSFCASTKNGLIRNLSTAEMLEQIYLLQSDIDVKIRNVVLMGSGEPLDNYKNVIKFLKIIHSPRGQNMSYRNITLSTVGLPGQINRLAQEKLPITLSLSLHSAFNEKRKEVIPTARKYSLEEIIAACKNYLQITNRRITIEYALVKGFNDSQEDADKLEELLSGMLYHVNLIPINPIAESDLSRPDSNHLQKFYNSLKSRGVNVTVRRELGGDINAACGQLRQYYLDNL